MSIAALQGLEKTLGSRNLFMGLDFNVERGERIGLIGANGSGKSTLFKMLLGEMTPDVGTVAISRGITLGHLPQDPVFDPANSVIDEAELAFARLHDLAHQMRDLEHQMAVVQGDELDRVLHQYQEVQHEFESGGGYAWQHRLEATLLGVGLPRTIWEQPTKTLSGGQRSRLALAKVLIGQPDLLLLDEPTNHLDLAAVEWLEEYLETYSGAVILISHDRYLLDRLATRMVWLTEARLRSYPGNYSAYVQQRDLQELSQQRAYEEQQADIEKQKEFIRRFGAGQRSKEAKGREKRLERLLKSDQVVSAVEGTRKISVSLRTEQRAGDQVLRVRELSKRFEQNVLWQDLKFDVRRGERIGIIGPNGSGKTTLLNVLLSRADADAGEIKWGANLALGYYDQRLDQLNPDRTVFEEVAHGRTGVTDQTIRNILGTMLFSGDDILKPIRLLSGGERARVRLTQLLLDRPNVLLLDEPTNHLDIPSSEALENALAGFEGTVFCVSHDRYFLDRVVNRLFVLQPPGMRDFDGNYTDWMQKKSQPAPAAPPQSPKASKAPPKPRQSGGPKRDNPFTRPFGKLATPELEQQITETEIALADCQSGLADPQAHRDPRRGKELSAEYESLQKKLKALEGEYFERGG